MKENKTLLFFATPSHFRKWLEKNHKTKTELLVGYYKVGSSKPSITWSQSVDQALCFGWIDGRKNTINNESYCIRFTPRKKSSIWSAINIKKVEELSQAGLMTDEGLKAFELRTDSKSRIYAHEKESTPLTKEYEKQFKNNKVAWNFFTALAPSYKKNLVHWIMSAKQEKTQILRLEKAIKSSEELKRIV